METLEYSQALKMGERAYRNAIARGEYPYLPALDEILARVDVQAEEKLGLVEIPLEQLVGTKTAGRKNAFAVNFMPLMKQGTEFSDKWNALYKYQTEVGNTDPILAYEFLNKFYVLEGNKRVSVFKFLDAQSIEGNVIRIIPKRNNSLENRIYYEFLDFYKCTEINYIWFTKEGSFEALTRAVGKEPGEIWSREEVRDFSSAYNRFYKRYLQRGGKQLPITAADAFLFYLSLYPYEDILQMSGSQLTREVARIWEELTVLNQDTEQSLVMEKVENTESGGLINKIFGITNSPKTLKVAFLHNRRPDVSSWSYSHELGRAHLEEVFADKIQTKSYFLSDGDLEPSELLEQMVQDGYNIIFTANQKFLDASLKKALEHPDVKILNCSINRPYNAIRTYYGRMYEAKFLCGMVAGAMTTNDKILYCADIPIYGAYANINAFALGVAMVNPRAKIYAHWLCDTTVDADQIIQDNHISIVSYTDMVRLSNHDRRFGLYQKEGDATLNLAMPVWNWGKFYEKIVHDIQEGNWNRGSDIKNRKAVNYWWGISSDIIDLIMSQNVPQGVRTLVEVMREEIFTERYHPFQGKITLQDGTVLGDEDSILSPEQIITMDWYVENIVGETPVFENLSEEAQLLINMQKGLTLSNAENS